MTPNRTRTGLFETPKGQSKPETGFGGKPAPPEVPRTRISPKLKRLVKTTTTKSEPGSLPPLQTSRNSVDQSQGSVASGDRSPLSTTSLDKSPRSVDSKLPRYSSRINSSLNRQARAAPKKSELQAELEATKEELKAANEKLVYLEKEKSQAFEELLVARSQANEASERLAVAIAAKKDAEEKIEMEKFRIVEIEQAGIEAAQQREEFWQKEVENIRNQHALDVSALLATTRELERLKNELAMTTESKNAATAHADDALKIAEIHAEKVGILSSEVNRLKALLESKLENAAKETAEHARRLEVEIDSLRDELRRTREVEKKLGEMETLVKGLKGEIAEAKQATSDKESLVVMWKKKAELLELKFDEAVKSEELAAQSLASAKQQLEDRDAAAKEAESEILFLRSKVNSLEIEILRYEGNLDKSNSLLKQAKGELLELEKTLPLLMCKIKIMEEEKNKVLDHTDETASRIIPTLQEENDKLSQELETIRDEVQTRKKAMEGLASALEEATVEAKESKEQLQTKQAEVADALGQLDELKKVLKSTEERYDSLLSDAWSEVAILKNMVQGSGIESSGIVSAREMEEDHYMISIKESEEEITEVKKEMDKLASELQASEKEAVAAQEEGVELRNRLEQARLEAKSAKEAAEVLIEESLQLKERLSDKEKALQSIAQENNELRIREEDASRKILQLSTMLEETVSRKEKEDHALSNKEEDHDVEPKVTESAMGAKVVEDAYKTVFNKESSAEPHHVKEHSLQEAIRVEGLKEYNDVLEDKFQEASNHINNPSSAERDSVPVPLDLKKHLKSGLESLDPKVEEMSPSRGPPEKKKKKFLSKLFKTKIHQR